MNDPKGDGFLSHELRRVNRFRALGSFVESFVIMENAKAGCEVQKFTMCKAKISTLWMLALHMVINGEGLVQQDPAGLQRVDEMGKSGRFK